MIFDRRLNIQKHFLLNFVVITIILVVALVFIRHRIHRTILEPLEIRTEIQAELLERHEGYQQDDFAEIQGLTEEMELIDQVDVAIFSESQLLWHSFSDSNRLQLIRRDYHWTDFNGVESSITLNGYTIGAPFQIDGDTYVLLKYYNKHLFRQTLNHFYLWAILILVYLLGIVLLIYHLIKNFVSKPINAIQKGIELISEEDYSFEYIESNYQEIDNLGLAVAELTRELKENRAELHSSEKRLALLLDHLNLGVILISQSGKIELVNPEATELLNINEQSVNQGFQSIIRSYTLVEMINTVLKTHEPKSNEIEIYIPTTKYIDVNIIPYGPAEEKIESILVLLYDISEIRRLETVRTEFVANASHELRTPVTAIKGFAETLLDGAVDNPELAKKFITIIANESNRLEVIINDILELSRVEKQSEPMTITHFNLYDTVKDLIEFFYKSANDKDITMTLINESSDAIEINADEHRVEQILINLIDNAINYSNANSEVVITIAQDREMAYFSVADNGIGIPEADQVRVFERFYRVDKGRSRNSGGTGLGLSIVRNLVKIMNGTIHVESKVGEGTTFYVSLPLN